jgi:hypothetical protein
MQDEIVVDDFAGQQGTVESGAHGERRVHRTLACSVRAARRCPSDRHSPGGASGYARIRRRHNDLGDDGLAGEEQCLNYRTRAGHAPCQQIRIANILGDLGALLAYRNPVGSSPADDRSCKDRTKGATAGASHVTSSILPPPVFGLAVTSASVLKTVQSRPSVGRTPPYDAASNLRMHFFDAVINALPVIWQTPPGRAAAYGPQLSDRSSSQQ